MIKRVVTLRLAADTRYPMPRVIKDAAARARLNGKTRDIFLPIVSLFERMASNSSDQKLS